MWIKIEDESKAGEYLYNEDLMDERVEFSSNCTAKVSEDVAESMIEHYELVSEYNTEEE